MHARDHEKPAGWTRASEEQTAGGGTRVRFDAERASHPRFRPRQIQEISRCSTSFAVNPVCIWDRVSDLHGGLSSKFTDIMTDVRTRRAGIAAPATHEGKQRRSF